MDDSTKTRCFAESLQLDQNQTSISINYIALYLHLWRKTWLNFGHSPETFSSFFLIFFDFIRIGGSKNFNINYIFGIYVDLNVIGWRKESEIKRFKDIFFDVLLINCAKIVESFDVFEYFTSLRLKTCRNSNNRSVNFVLVCRIFHNVSLIRKTLITDIC